MPGATGGAQLVERPSLGFSPGRGIEPLRRTLRSAGSLLDVCPLSLPLPPARALK